MSFVGDRKKEKKSLKEMLTPSVSSLKLSSKPFTLQKLPSNGSLGSTKSDKNLSTARSSRSFFMKQKDDTVASPSTKKSPIMQMREEFDDLKIKKEEQDHLIAAQTAELEALKRQLAVAIPPSNPSNREEFLKTIQERESALRDKEEELEHIREQLEQERLESVTRAVKVPTIAIEEEVRELREQNEQVVELLARREQLLADKEKELDTLRTRIEDDTGGEVRPALEEVSAQLATLQNENGETLKRLKEKERELDDLKSKLTPAQSMTDKRFRRLTVDLETERANLARLVSLEAELEEQKKCHEQILLTHSQTLAEKDSLLKQHTDSLLMMQINHETALKELQQQQKRMLQEVQARNELEIAQLRDRVTQAETARRNSNSGHLSGRTNDPSSPATKFTDDDVENLLSEFEQAKYTHQTHVATLQKSHAAQISNMQQSHFAQISNFRKSQTKERHGLSWPLPSSQENPRKRNMSDRTNSWVSTIKEGVIHEFWPEDPHLVMIFGSSMSMSMNVKKNQEHIKQVLLLNKIPFEYIDVSTNDIAFKHMYDKSHLRDLPQVFIGREFRGLYPTFLEAHQSGTLIEFLQPIDSATEDWVSEAEEARSEALITSPLVASPHSLNFASSVKTPRLPRSPISPRSSQRSSFEDNEVLRELEGNGRM